jgi:hypothetical protein
MDDKTPTTEEYGWMKVHRHYGKERKLKWKWTWRKIKVVQRRLKSSMAEELLSL